MSAYLVFTKEKTLDPAEMAIYQQKVPGTFGSFQLKILAAYGAQEVLEGDPAEGVVIVEFPTAEEAKPGTTAPPIRRSGRIVSRVLSTGASWCRVSSRLPPPQGPRAAGVHGL
jgi:uncharacterized protein (DUF1330 family)